jgi:AcrR family transcriptional regulator
MQKLAGSRKRPPVRAPAAPESGLRERKKARLRQRIAETGLALYRELGHRDVTVEEICRRVEISQPTFYKYFASKEAILAEHATVGWGELMTGLLDRPGSVEQRLRWFFGEIAKRMTRERKLWAAIAVSNAYNPVRDPELLRSPEAGTRVLERLLAQGQERDELTRDFSAQRLASMLEGVMLRTTIEWGAGFDARPLGDSMAESLELFLRAARSSGRARSRR